MSSIIEKKEEIVLTRAQFEKLRDNGGLVIGCTYKIKDDPTAKDLVDGIATSKKSEQDSNGNIIHTTYRRLDDSYSITDIDNQFTTKLANYYTKQETYTKDQVDYLVGLIPKFGVERVESLPTENISISTIYLLPVEGEDNNYYDEYMYINNQWELIGSTRVDLSNYYTKEETIKILNGKVDKVEYSKDQTFVDGSDGGVLGRLYMRFRDNTDNSIVLNAQNNKYTVPYRDSTGNFYVGDPIQPWHTTNKQYVDNAITTEAAAREELANSIGTNVEDIYTTIENLSSFKGTYSSTETYKTGDIIVYNNFMFISLVDDNINHTPSLTANVTSSYWRNMNYSAARANVSSSTSNGYLLFTSTNSSTTAPLYARTDVSIGSNGNLSDKRGLLLAATELDGQSVLKTGSGKVASIGLWDLDNGELIMAKDIAESNTILIYNEDDEVV